MRTDADGNPLSLRDPPREYPFGPYILKFPKNPFVDPDVGRSVAGGEEDAPHDGSTGWYFNTRTTRFSPNDPEHKDQ